MIQYSISTFTLYFIKLNSEKYFETWLNFDQYLPSKGEIAVRVFKSSSLTDIVLLTTVANRGYRLVRAGLLFFTRCFPFSFCLSLLLIFTTSLQELNSSRYVISNIKQQIILINSKRYHPPFCLRSY